VAVPDGTATVTLTCVSCHDPHGNGAYRNLRASPGGHAAAAPVVWQGVVANGSNAASVYVRGNVRYVSGMSEWCIDCHDTIATDHGAPSLAVHPWDVAIFGAAKASYTVWSGTIANRVPVQNPLAATHPPPDQGDRVFCLSCHKAHGSPAAATLIRADQATTSSTCLECHDP
jgi:predicted CXXCH cytochrome family protein